MTCGDCSSKYIGQTKRTIEKRYKEHLACIKNAQPKKSSIAEHALTNLHSKFDSNSIKLKKNIINLYLLDAYESYYIHKLTKNNSQIMNTDGGNITSCLFNCV